MGVILAILVAVAVLALVGGLVVTALLRRRARKLGQAQSLEWSSTVYACAEARAEF